MAEQGRKARESAARLEEAGAIGSLSSSGGNEDGLCGALSGMMPLRCGVSGRQVGSFTVQELRRARLTDKHAKSYIRKWCAVMECRRCLAELMREMRRA